MYMGLWEWTISRYSGNADVSRSSGYTDISFRVDTTGIVSSSYVSTNFNAARPVFYLESAVAYAGGNGTITNPIRISR